MLPIRSTRLRIVQEVVLTALCAALYAVLGYASYLGIFTPAIGVVRFWPSVFIPAVFAIAFGPRVGGIGAAIGIFISDMLIHGNALLSLSVGVPSNFTCFYIVGLLARRLKGTIKPILIGILEETVILLTVISCYMHDLLSSEVAIAYIIGMSITIAFTLAYALIKGKKYSGLILACNTGLFIGATIIGIGVYAFSQFFTLPTGEKNLPIGAALLWMLWVYVTEIPFMISLSPPIVEIISKIFMRSGE